jgi:hypothetical protein
MTVMQEVYFTDRTVAKPLQRGLRILVVKMRAVLWSPFRARAALDAYPAPTSRDGRRTRLVTGAETRRFLVGGKAVAGLRYPSTRNPLQSFTPIPLFMLALACHMVPLKGSNSSA